MIHSLRFVVTFVVVIASFVAHAQQQPEQVVARVKLSSPNNKEEPVYAEAGDVLSVIESQEQTVLVQSPAGRRANVRRQDVVTLAESKLLYDTLIKSDPTNGSLYASRALVYSIANDQQQVIADLTMATRLGLKTPSIWVNRGAAYAATGEFDKAVADYDQAIRQGYDDPSAYINRGVAQFAKGDAKKASADFTLALKKDPANPFVLMQRGVAYQRQQDWGKTLADFTALIEKNDKNIEALSSRGFTYYLKGDSKQAVEDFTKVIKLNPKSALAYNNRGFNRQVIGQYQEAIADFDKAIELSPKYALAYQNKAWLLATCPDDSIRDGQRAFAAAKQAGDLRQWKVLTDIKTVAAAYAEAGDFDKAVKWQEKAVAMAEGDARSGEEEMLKLFKAKAPFRFAPASPTVE